MLDMLSTHTQDLYLYSLFYVVRRQIDRGGTSAGTNTREMNVAAASIHQDS